MKESGGHYEQEAREKEKERAAHNRIGYAKKGGPSSFYCFPASEREGLFRESHRRKEGGRDDLVAEGGREGRAGMGMT